METIRQIFSVDRKEIAYLRMTLESYDGMVVVRTVDPQKGLVELLIAPGCQNLIAELLDDLLRREALRLIPQL